MADLKDLRERRAKAVHDAREIVTAAEAEKRDLDVEEKARFDGFMDDADRLRAAIETEERLREAERETAQRQDDTEDPRDRDVRANAGTAAEKRARAFDAWLRSGRLGPELEHRDLQAEDGPGGGYVTAPEQFVSQLIKFVDDQVFVRRLATVNPLTSASSLGAPELVADPSDADWTTELGTGSLDSAMKFGKREMYPHPMAKRIKISKTLMRRSRIPIEALVRDRLGYKFAITEEKAFITGTGQQQPLGLMTASKDGISTARDVATGNTATEITGDGLLECKYKLKAQYMARGVWVFHRDAMKMIAKLKDGEGQYLWRPGISSDEPDRLLGRPIFMSEYMPNTFTTGKLVGLFGDLSHYWIADALNMQMQRLDELYAETNQIGFIARRETDGAPVLAEAFARVKLG